MGVSIQLGVCGVGVSCVLCEVRVCYAKCEDYVSVRVLCEGASVFCEGASVCCEGASVFCGCAGVFCGCAGVFCGCVSVRVCSVGVPVLNVFVASLCACACGCPERDCGLSASVLSVLSVCGCKQYAHRWQDRVFSSCCCNYN